MMLTRIRAEMARRIIAAEAVYRRGMGVNNVRGRRIITSTKYLGLSSVPLRIKLPSCSDSLVEEVVLLYVLLFIVVPLAAQGYLSHPPFDSTV